MGTLPGGGARFGFKIIKSGCLEACKIDLKFVSDPGILFGDLICDWPYRVGGLYDLYECGGLVYTIGYMVIWY